MVVVRAAVVVVVVGAVLLVDDPVAAVVFDVVVVGVGEGESLPLDESLQKSKINYTKIISENFSIIF